MIKCNLMYEFRGCLDIINGEFAGCFPGSVRTWLRYAFRSAIRRMMKQLRGELGREGRKPTEAGKAPRV